MRLPSSPPPIIRIANGAFYRHQPTPFATSASASHAHENAHAHPTQAFFKGLTFELPSRSTTPHNWCVVGPSLSGKTTFLQILRGQHLSTPPTARSFPYLASDQVPYHLRTPSRALQYVGFDSQGGGGLGPAGATYLSARYESRRELTDFSLRDFLLGNMQLNPSKLPGGEGVDEALFERVVLDLRLASLLDLPVTSLSNGQGRRARIARALLTSPDVLLLDEPFMGLDPPTVAGLSPLLHSLAEKASPRLVLSARPQDPLPEWITHLVYLRSDAQIGSMGPKDTVLEGLRKYVRGVRSGTLAEDETLPVHALSEMGKSLTNEGITGEGMAEDFSLSIARTSAPGVATSESSREPLIEMHGCKVKYGDKVALGNWTEERDGQKADGLHWTVRRGERWGVFGPNGSGKTTIVSLLCSDHPQTYSLPIKLFGRSRLPEPGSGQRPLTFWDIQSRIGHSSPEIHQHMPRNLTVRQVLESAWADTFRSRPNLNSSATEQVEATLRWFERELNPGFRSQLQQQSVSDLTWASDYMLGELSFSAQRILLFLRAIIKHPDVVVLDEAFGGMDDAVRDKCMLFLAHGEENVYSVGSRLSSSGSLTAAAVVDSSVAKAGSVKVKGLSERQALICISHVKEEVPDCVSEWLCLPEASTGLPARFGRLGGPLRASSRRWAEIWGIGQGNYDVADHPIHILGLGNLGKYVAYALGRSHAPGLPPTNLIFHRLGLLDDWKAADRSIRYSTEFEKSGRTECPPSAGFGEELLQRAKKENPQALEHHLDVQASKEHIKYLIVATKAYATRAALTPIKHRLSKDSHILFLQNGMGVADEVSDSIFPHPATRPTYWVGICHAGVYSTSPFSIVHAGRGPLVLAVIRGPSNCESSSQAPGLTNSPEYQALVERLRFANGGILDVQAMEPDAILPHQLAKLVVNSIINPLSVYRQCKNGQLLNIFEWKPKVQGAERRLYTCLLQEAGAIVRALLPRDAPKKQLSDDALDALVKRVARQTANNTSSMLQDVLAGRPTEVQYLNGYLVKQGQRLGLPYTHHRDIYERVRVIEGRRTSSGIKLSRGRWISSSCPPPSWLTNTLDASAVPRRSSFMSEHSRCTDRTGSSSPPPVPFSVLHSAWVMSAPSPSRSGPSHGMQTPSNCLVEADDTIPSSARTSVVAPGGAAQANSSSTSPGACIRGSRTSSQKKRLAAGPGSLLVQSSSV
ncbi:2-dehydropantoate 2-reductase [Parathielavia hyrcaniae]|uniref:2-dehydropantoate 2-reductase n=1 Tax=Parathielavia hyrcaniae TaxID=113614 RepID=A0AAN6PS85_9PEZI|nr:2-dehydropantoate 2-reductase [Parathielavia hyrcaniae]